MKENQDPATNLHSKSQKVVLSLKLHESQKKVYQSPAKYIFLMAGRRYGKTLLLVRKILKKAEKPNSRIWYVAPFKNQAKDIAWIDLLQIIPKQIIKRKHEAELFIEFINGSTLFLKGADKDNLLGTGLDFLGIDEAQDLKEDVWETVLRPMLKGRNGEAMLIGTKRRMPNWYRRTWLEIEKGKLPLSEAFYFPSTTNPHISPEEWEIERKSIKPWVWEREFISDPHAPDIEQKEGAKYEEFAPRTHLIRPFKLPNTFRFFRGLDWGMDHPTACVWAAVTPHPVGPFPAGSVFIYDEHRQRGMSPEQQAKIINMRTVNTLAHFCPDVKTRPQVEATIGDPRCWNRESDGLSIAHKFARAGLPMNPGKREDKALSGAATVKFYLKPVAGPPKLYIFTNCDMLKDEMLNLQWADKLNDDITDALRYLLKFLASLSISNDGPAQAMSPYDQGSSSGFYEDKEGHWQYRLQPGDREDGSENSTFEEYR